MKKILLYVNSMNKMGGIERVISNLSNAFVDKYKVTILVKDKPTSAYPLDSRVEVLSLNHEMKWDMNNRLKRITAVPINIIQSIFGLRKFFKNHKYDIVYTSFPTNGLEVYFADKNYREKIVASEHASYYAYNSVYKNIKKWLYPRLNAISVPTTMDTNIYIKLGYKAYYIPHLSTYNEIHENSMKSRRIINVGRLTSDKQQSLLLDIWKTVNDLIPNLDWKLQIIGSGEEEERLKQKISEYSFDNVEMIPHITRISDYYTDAELFAFTSKMEGFGMVLLEAMSFGVPCISFDCPSGSRDIIDDNKNGILVECYNSSLYAKKIVEFINSSEEEKKMMSKASQNKVLNWDNKAIIDKWIKLFEIISA